MTKNILLVEGSADKLFFQAFCLKLGLSVDIKDGEKIPDVVTPKDLSSKENTRDSKEGVFHILENLILNRLKTGNVEKLAIIVDADYQKDGKGFQPAFDRVEKIIKPLGYYFDQNQKENGIIFKHKNLNSIGLWIMPNNQNDGMLEDWIQSCVSIHDVNQKKLFTHAKETVNLLPQNAVQLFNEIHKSKSEIATWLAWQKKPDHGLYWAIKENLLDENHFYYQNLVYWLLLIFNSNEQTNILSL